MPSTIFYSWQSDTKSAANRGLIGDALEAALKEFRGIKRPGIDPVIDRDTAGVPGSPDIASTILDKIDKCDALVADVTLVDAAVGRRRFPNPNVLIEVGYAIKAKSFSRLILVFNTFFGEIEKLPFDIRGRRVISYCSDPNIQSRTEQKRTLTKDLFNALINILPTDKDDGIGGHQLPDVTFEATRRELEELRDDEPDKVAARLSTIATQLERATSISAIDYASLINAVVDLGWRNSRVPNALLLELCEKSIARHPTSAAYFDKGLICGRMGLSYDSIGAYMKAIDLGDPNPSLCFLNAGNRYREMNDEAIALSFYEKSVALNKSQANAWLAAANLYSQAQNVESAVRCYQGFLNWYHGLPESAKGDPRAQQAGVAQSYVDLHAS
ncbi:MAG: hypothetical protein ACT4QA_06550 [Panacagrimonas sp.]